MVKNPTKTTKLCFNRNLSFTVVAHHVNQSATVSCGPREVIYPPVTFVCGNETLISLVSLTNLGQLPPLGFANELLYLCSNYHMAFFQPTVF